MNKMAALIRLSLISVSALAVSSVAISGEPATKNALSDAVVFTPAVSRTRHLTPGYNTIQSGEFTIPAGKTGYITQFTFNLSATPNVMDKIKFFINGGQALATITNFQNQVVVVVRHPTRFPLTGVATFILQARMIDATGFQFQPTLTGAQIVDRDRFVFGSGPENLPLVGDTLIMN